MKANKNLWIVVGIVLLHSIGFSIVLPLMPFIVVKYVSAGQVVVGMSALVSVFAACSFLASPVCGALSDRYGRKIVLMISLCGSVAGYVLFGIGQAFWILILARVIDGLTAGNISTLFAYVSDSTKPTERTKWFGYIGAAMGMGKLGGPALGGMLGSISISLPFYFTAVLILISVFAVHYLLPESLETEQKTKYLALKSMNPFVHFKEIFAIRNIKTMLIPGILFYAALCIFQFNFTLFLKDVFSWGPARVGGLLTLIGIVEITSRAVILPRLLRQFRGTSIGVAGLFLFIAGLGLIFVSIYTKSVIVISLAVILIISGEGLFDPTYNGRLSQMVEEKRQGQLQGVLQSLQSSNNMLIPLFAAGIYLFSSGLLYAMAIGFVLVAASIYSGFIERL